MLTILFTLSVQLQCLSKNIYYEAGIESDKGKLAVAQVTLNRVESGLWGDDICSVVYAKDQFSWTKKRRKLHKPKGKAWADSRKIAIAAVAGKRIKPLKKSMYYHADYVKPYWSKKKKKVAKIGTHIFYKEKK